MTGSSLLLRAGLAFLGSLAIAGYALRRGSLAPSGAALALLIGTSIGAGGGGAFFAVLITFFVTSTALGKAGRARKEAVKREFSKGDTRDGWQALANGGVAALAAVGMGLSPSPLWAAAFLGAMATANGDTWATELGVLSRAEPFSLLSFRRVPRGTSGAVSALGMAATAGGALVVGLVAAAGSEAFRMHPVRIVLTSVIAGTFGSLADSLLGATLQAGYHCPACDRACEAERHHCGAEATFVRGFRFLNNDVVNLMATLLGALLGAAFAVWGP